MYSFLTVPGISLYIGLVRSGRAASAKAARQEEKERWAMPAGDQQ